MSQRGIGVHASHEQFPPGRLLGLMRLAQDAGFDRGMCSDHWAPWSEDQGESAFAWSWLGAALEATTLPFGVVNAPGQRYHPAIIAQAVATLNAMYPDRLWVALGSGQLLNEHITGDPWPTKAERNERLRASAQVMRGLWRGATVDHQGLLSVSQAKLWTRPAREPMLVGAAVTPETAAFVAGWADALITVSQPGERLDAVVDAFRSHGGAGKPMYLQVHVSWAPSEAQAREQATMAWRHGGLPNSVLTDLALPGQIAAAAAHLRVEELDGAVRISADLGRHAAWIEADFARGFEAVYLHEVGPQQERFVETFGRTVLPALRSETVASDR
jgi:coenzyme F420-dependent glucose-6-phosphate dehydrogenase